MPVGTSLYAPADGVIIYAGWDTSGYGFLMKIEHSDGSITYLAHLSGFVRTSGNVTVGEFVARSGDSGNSTGQHLHLEVRKDGGYVNLRTIDGVTWTSGDPNQPCAPPGTMDGQAYGPIINDGVILYPLDNYLGDPKIYFSPTHSPIEFPLMPSGSIRIVSGWSAKLYPDIFLNGQCITQSYPDLDLVYIYSFLGIRAIEVYDNPTCSPMPPFDPVCTLQMRNGEMIDSIGGCEEPTPTPGGTPTPGPSPTPPPPPPGGSWTVKVFSSMDECNDNPACNPASTYYQTSFSGTNFNLNFPDGVAFGIGGTVWGANIRQTINFPSGIYYIHADHDDGVKVWVYEEAKMDVLGSSENNTTCPGIYLSGPTDIAILWKNTGGGAHLNFSIDQNGSACEPNVHWDVWYYHDPNLCSFPNCDLQQVFCDTDIPGTWFSIDPYPGGLACGNEDQTWGRIWKQTLYFPEGDYVFHSLNNDDGVKLFLGDTNIMDIPQSSADNMACPPRHLSGNVPVTVIHNNTGGDARINVWWDTNTAPCDPPPAGEVWVWKDAQDATHVTLQNGDPAMANLYLARSGVPVEVTRDLWYAVSGGIEAVIPVDVVSFLVDQGNVPIIDGGNQDEWYHYSGDPHWVVRKLLFVWIDEIGQTHLTYQGEYGRPQIRYYTSGSEEQYTSDLWYDLGDGSGIEAVIPDNFEAMKVDKWIRPTITDGADTWWLENNYWMPKRTIYTYLIEGDLAKVYYYWGLPLPVTLGRYGEELETRTDLWQTEVIDGHTNYFMTLPSDVVAFKIEGGPIPQIVGWAEWHWSNYSTTHWVAEKTTWIYRSWEGETVVLYTNTDVVPEDVNIIYYLFGDPSEHQTTSWWTQTGDGLMMTVPREMDAFLITRGPAPLITDQSASEWRTTSEDGKWICRKPIRVWIDWWGTTFVTYWHEQQAPYPNIHYVLNGEEIVTVDLWIETGDGIQAMIPDGTTHFMIEVQNQPYIETSASDVWELPLLPDLWLQLIDMPMEPTPTPTAPTATPGPSPTPYPTATPTPPPGGYRIFLPIINNWR